ncbi:MAG: SDR family oxidoreductase [Planctomycetes bacterium]|nr:SDR family oxidoreductase [Planctomycetota bacterium]
MPPDGSSPLLVTGASGLLGWNVARAALARGMGVAGTGRSERPPGLEKAAWFRTDLALPSQPTLLLREVRPSALVHCAAIADIGACEEEPCAAWALNAGAVAEVARAALESRLRWIQVSTDLVFDGSRAPYRPGDPRSPLSTYGATKALAERLALASGGDALVVRIPLLFGASPTGGRSASEKLVLAARRGEEVVLFRDEWRTPLDAGEAAAALLDLLASDRTGILHVAGPERLSRLELGREILRAAGLLPKARIRETSRLEHPGPPRPEDLTLEASEAAQLIRCEFLPVQERLARDLRV